MQISAHKENPGINLEESEYKFSYIVIESCQIKSLATESLIKTIKYNLFMSFFGLP